LKDSHDSTRTANTNPGPKPSADKDRPGKL